MEHPDMVELWIAARADKTERSRSRIYPASAKLNVPISGKPEIGA